MGFRIIPIVRLWHSAKAYFEDKKSVIASQCEHFISRMGLDVGSALFIFTVVQS
jgi:hypothetical protein